MVSDTTTNTNEDIAVAIDVNYKAPAPKTVQDIIQSDADDESLRKYKEKLLGSNADKIVIDVSNPKNVIVRSLTLMSPDRDDVTMDLCELCVS